MLDSIYPIPLRLLRIFVVKMFRFCNYVCNLVMDIITLHNIAKYVSL